jgi:hypothetical protein
MLDRDKLQRSRDVCDALPNLPEDALAVVISAADLGGHATPNGADRDHPGAAFIEPSIWKAPWRFRVIFAVAAFALGGCCVTAIPGHASERFEARRHLVHRSSRHVLNANQTINPSGQGDLRNIYPDYNPYDPESYAQNHTGWGGGR